MSRAYPIKHQSPRLSVTKAWLLGVLAGDGGVYRNNIRVFCGLDESLALTTRDAVRKIYGVHVKLLKNPSTKAPFQWVVECNRTLVSKDVKTYAPFGIYTWRLPRVVRDGSDAIKTAWLSGYVDADGYVQNGDKRAISTSSVNRLGTLDVSMLLESLGVGHSIYLDKAEKNRPNKSDAFLLSSGNKQTVTQFARVLDLRSQDKKQDLVDLLASYTHQPDMALGQVDLLSVDQKVTRRRKMGMSSVEIASDLGLTVPQVVNFCLSRKVSPIVLRERSDGRFLAFGPVESLLPRIVQLRDQGRTAKEIAECLGLKNEDSVHSALYGAYKKGLAEKPKKGDKMASLVPKVLALRPQHTFREIDTLLGIVGNGKGSPRSLNILAWAKRKGMLSVEQEQEGEQERHSTSGGSTLRQETSSPGPSEIPTSRGDA